MENIALIGIDLGKNSFHIHCQDRRGKAVYRKKFTRPKLIEFLATCPATTIAMEACGGSHFMARKLEELGHSPKLISPQFVRPFVKSNKNDFVDAEAICEAASRPSMRFVGTVAKLAMRQPFVLFKGLTFQKLCLPGAFRPGDHHNKMLRPGLCV
ncbi:transposase, partial [Enterobacter hormaechei]|nr:transposase [Enterobacter hormaechei]